VTGKERIVRALQRDVPDRVPTFEWFIDASVGQALVGGDDPIDIVQRLDLDGINVRADYRKESLDDTTLVDEWGVKRQLTGDCLPALLASPIQEIRNHTDYTFPDPAAPHRLATLEKALHRLGDEKAVILNLRDGFSDMRDLLGYEGALMALLLEPKRFMELLERTVQYNLALAAIAKQRYAVDIVATTDDVADANGLLMSPATYFELVAPQFRQAIQGYKELGYRCIKHCDGNIDAVVDFWVRCGIDALDPIDPGAGYTMADMKGRYGNKICLKGNVDCTGALCDGTPEQVEQEVRQCILDGGPGGGLILSSSNTIHRGVNPENYRAMLSALRRYGSYPDLG
jgi:uroporphyrinogen decarboxylase